jgi:hypothetical protein
MYKAYLLSFDVEILSESNFFQPWMQMDSAARREDFHWIISSSVTSMYCDLSNIIFNRTIHYHTLQRSPPTADPEHPNEAENPKLQ